MKHLKEYNKYIYNTTTIYRVWDNDHNVVVEFNESGNVFLASAFSDSGSEILEFLGINPAQHEIEDEKIDNILDQIRSQFPQYTVEEF